MSRRVSSIALVAMFIGCSGTASPAPSTGGTAPSALASSAPTRTASASPGASTAPPSPLPGGPAVRDGESWLLYAWFAPGKSTRDVFLVRADGTDGHAILGDVPGVHWSPSWSSDGKRIVFIVTDAVTPDGSIWTAAADGSAAARLSDGDGACPDGMAHPSWSPDGTRIAFICYPDPGGKQGSVAILDLASHLVTRLTTVKWPEHLDGAPTWSPDGRSLAYAILHWDPTDQFITGSLLAVIPAAGGKERRITAFDTNFSGPDWSPDGTELATFSYDIGNMHTTPHASNLYLIKPDGTGLRQITRSSVDGNRRIVAPRWTPDGTRLVCAVGTSSASDFTIDDLQLGVVDPGGGEPLLFTPTVHGSQPDPRPTP